MWAEQSAPPTISARVCWHNLLECCLPADYVFADYPLLLLKHDDKLVLAKSFKSVKQLVDSIEPYMIQYNHETKSK